MRMIKSVFVLLFTACMLFATACEVYDDASDDNGEPLNDGSVDTGPDSASDTDADTDSDADSDSDNDVDVDSDSDSDSDGDADPDPQCWRYVDIDSKADDPDGTSWNMAYKTVQQGIDSAAGVSGGCQVWVAEGVYYTFEDHWENTVRLKSEVHVYGGFRGDEIQRDKRDYKAHQTILDGHDESKKNQVFHVVTGSDQSILDGFVITGGNAKGNDPHCNGGGMFNLSASPVVRNCVFSDNLAGDENDYGMGGGMYNEENSSLRISNCIFRNNSRGGICNEEVNGTVTDTIFFRNEGAALFNSEDVELTVEDCMFISNSTEYGGAGTSICTMESGNTLHYKRCVFAGNIAGNGGAVYCSEPNAPLFEDSIFSGNFAIEEEGGAIVIGQGQLTVKRSIFAGNWSNGNAGAYYMYRSSGFPSTDITNNVFIGNVARENGGAILLEERTMDIVNSTFYGNKSHGHGASICLEDFGTINLTNVIMWDGETDSLYEDEGIFNAGHSDIHNGGFSGNGNIDEDPVFMSVADVSGTWTGVSFNSETYQTELKDSTKTWGDGDFESMFVHLEVGNIVDDAGVSDELSLYIADNDSDTIMVWGDMRDFIQEGYAYYIIDVSLDESSPCIDTADDSEAPDRDLNGNSRVDVPGTGDEGTSADMGAFEYSN